MVDELDLNGLDKLFSESNDNNKSSSNQNLVDFETDINYDDAVETLKKNIYNANQLLLKIQSEMNNGNFSARLAEVASTVINSVTQASKEILTDQNYEDYMEVRRALVELKNKEIEIKQAKLSSPQPGQTNILIASREDILKTIEEREIKQIENNDDDEE